MRANGNGACAPLRAFRARREHHVAQVRGGIVHTHAHALG